MKRLVLIALLLSGCAQVNSIATVIQSMCNSALEPILLATPVGPWIAGTCTVAGIAKVASDPAGQTWFADVIAKAKAAAGK